MTNHRIPTNNAGDIPCNLTYADMESSAAGCDSGCDAEAINPNGMCANCIERYGWELYDRLMVAAEDLRKRLKGQVRWKDLDIGRIMELVDSIECEVK